MFKSKNIAMKYISIAIICSLPSIAVANTLEVWIRVFIPDPGNSGLASENILPRPGHDDSSVVSSVGYCFSTDHRGFSTDSTLSSRMETRFSVTAVDEYSAVVAPESGRVTAANSMQIDCASGDAILEKDGIVNADIMGTPALADGLIQFIGQSQGTNAIPLFGMGPSIDYSFDFIWNPEARELKSKISYGKFPAIEVYARQKDGKWKSILKELPTGAPWNLGADMYGIGFVTKSSTDSL